MIQKNRSPKRLSDCNPVGLQKLFLRFKILETEPAKFVKNNECSKYFADNR